MKGITASISFWLMSFDRQSAMPCQRNQPVTGSIIRRPIPTTRRFEERREDSLLDGGRISEGGSPTYRGATFLGIRDSHGWRSLLAGLQPAAASDANGISETVNQVLLAGAGAVGTAAEADNGFVIAGTAVPNRKESIAPQYEGDGERDGDYLENEKATFGMGAHDCSLPRPSTIGEGSLFVQRTHPHSHRRDQRLLAKAAPTAPGRLIRNSWPPPLR